MTNVRLGIVFAFVLFSSASASAGGGCYATCTTAAVGGCYAKCTTGGVCTLEKPNAKADEKAQLLPDCWELKLAPNANGSLELQFRANGRRGEAHVQPGQEFRTQLAAFKQLDCLVGDSSKCPDRIESRSMGKAFDPDAPAEITGEPCQLGLPCGKVGLASDGSLPIRIADRTLTGTLTVFSPRGGGNAKTSDLAGGAMLVPTGVLEPGKTYRYRLALRDGSVRAAGEFLVLSQNAQRDSDAALAKAMEEPQDTRERAVIRSLMLDGRDWEAFERTLEASK